MHGEIVLAALVLVVAILVAADFFRRTSDASHEHPAGTEPGNERGPAHDAGRETYPARHWPAARWTVPARTVPARTVFARTVPARTGAL